MAAFLAPILFAATKIEENRQQKSAAKAAGKALDFQKDQAKKQEDKFEKQEEEAQKLEDEQKKRSQDATRIRSAEEDRDSSRKRQRRQAAGAQGRQDTILTSPLGVLGSAAGKRKTLLGT